MPCQTLERLRIRVIAAAAAAAIASAAAAGCGRAPEADEGGSAGSKPDIILITVDALRADHLGLYGYDRPTSPSLDAFAREAVVVRTHITQAPYTKAAMASLFTGLFPTAHKAFTTSRSFGQAMSGHVAGALPVTDVLDGRLETLAERLSAEGYQTHGLNTNPFLLSEFGFGQGFDRYEFLAEEGQFSNARDVIARALEIIRARDRARPLFLWLHLMEPHSPYTPPPALRAMFPPRQPPLLAPVNSIPAWIVVEGSTDARFYEALYDAEIREADEALGEFLGAIRTRRLWGTAIIAITSDHGEEFFEHGGFEHNRTLYNETLRVPLIVRAPSLDPAVREAVTQAADLLPTLVARAGGAPPEGLHGADIWPVLQGTRSGEPYAYAELVGTRYSIQSRDWKLISNLQGAHELYNLRDDPHERENVVATHVDRTVQLRDLLAHVLGSAAARGAELQGQFAPIPPRVLERLKALGYVQ